MKHKLNMSPEDVYESIGKHVSMQGNILMMWNGRVKMALEPTWTICAKRLNLRLSLEQKL